MLGIPVTLNDANTAVASFLAIEGVAPALVAILGALFFPHVIAGITFIFHRR